MLQITWPLDCWVLLPKHQNPIFMYYGSPPTTNRWIWWVSGSLIPLQRCSHHILQPQLTWQHQHWINDSLVSFYTLTCQVNFMEILFLVQCFDISSSWLFQIINCCWDHLHWLCWNTIIRLNSNGSMLTCVMNYELKWRVRMRLYGHWDVPLFEGGQVYSLYSD